MSRAPLVAVALAAVLTSACGMQPVRPTEAQLRVISVPETAQVFVDDRFIATGRRLARRAHAMPAGVHHVTIQAAGHFPHDVEVDLPPGTTTVRIRLRPIPR